MEEGRIAVKNIEDVAKEKNQSNLAIINKSVNDYVSANQFDLDSTWSQFKETLQGLYDIIPSKDRPSLEHINNYVKILNDNVVRLLPSDSKEIRALWFKNARDNIIDVKYMKQFENNISDATKVELGLRLRGKYTEAEIFSGQNVQMSKIVNALREESEELQQSDWKGLTDRISTALNKDITGLAKGSNFGAALGDVIVKTIGETMDMQKKELEVKAAELKEFTRTYVATHVKNLVENIKLSDKELKPLSDELEKNEDIYVHERSLATDLENELHDKKIKVEDEKYELKQKPLVEGIIETIKTTDKETDIKDVIDKSFILLKKIGLITDLAYFIKQVNTIDTFMKEKVTDVNFKIKNIAALALTAGSLGSMAISYFTFFRKLKDDKKEQNYIKYEHKRDRDYDIVEKKHPFKKLYNH